MYTDSPSGASRATETMPKRAIIMRNTPIAITPPCGAGGGRERTENARAAAARGVRGGALPTGGAWHRGSGGRRFAEPTRSPSESCKISGPLAAPNDATMISASASTRYTAFSRYSQALVTTKSPHTPMSTETQRS